MPDGAESVRGLSIRYPSASRHDSGVYICSAHNGLDGGDGDPVEQKIKLDVHRECPQLMSVKMKHNVIV